MIDAVLLVLREVLEAALLLSLLLALGSQLGVSTRWALFALTLGALGSLSLSMFAATLSNAFEGTGQELLNIGLYGVAILSFFILSAALAPEAVRRSAIKPQLVLPICGSLIVASSMSRECYEVWLYLDAVQHGEAGLTSPLIGGGIGLGLGISIGVLVYYALALMPRLPLLRAYQLLAALVVGGLTMQATKLLMQIGWLDSRQALWDTSAWISEQGWLGQFLHALFGYDANPDRTQVISYLTVVLLLLAGSTWVAKSTRNSSHA